MNIYWQISSQEPCFQFYYRKTSFLKRNLLRRTFQWIHLKKLEDEGWEERQRTIVYALQWSRKCCSCALCRLPCLINDKRKQQSRWTIIIEGKEDRENRNSIMYITEIVYITFVIYIYIKQFDLMSLLLLIYIFIELVYIRRFNTLVWKSIYYIINVVIINATVVWNYNPSYLNCTIIATHTYKNRKLCTLRITITYIWR